MLIHIIGISGRARSGKDTAASVSPGNSVPVFRFAFADYLKDVAKVLGWDGEKDDKGRKFLIDLGTAMRTYDPRVFIDKVIKKMERKWGELYSRGDVDPTKRPSHVVFYVTDLRFFNEHQALRGYALDNDGFYTYNNLHINGEGRAEVQEVKKVFGDSPSESEMAQSGDMACRTTILNPDVQTLHQYRESVLDFLDDVMHP